MVTAPSRDSRTGLDVAYLSALTTSAKLAEEEQRIKNHFESQTMSLKVGNQKEEKKTKTKHAKFEAEKEQKGKEMRNVQTC